MDTLETDLLRKHRKTITGDEDPEHHLDEQNGEMKIRQEPVEPMRDDLKDALTEVKAMIAERAEEAGERKLMSLKGTTQSFTILRGEGDEAER